MSSRYCIVTSNRSIGLQFIMLNGTRPSGSLMHERIALLSRYLKAELDLMSIYVFAFNRQCFSNAKVHALHGGTG